MLSATTVPSSLQIGGAACVLAVAQSLLFHPFAITCLPHCVGNPQLGPNMLPAPQMGLQRMGACVCTVPGRAAGGVLQDRLLPGTLQYKASDAMRCACSRATAAASCSLASQVHSWQSVPWRVQEPDGSAPAESKMRNLPPAELLAQLPPLQKLLERLMDCLPRGVAARHFVVQASLLTIAKESFQVRSLPNGCRLLSPDCRAYRGQLPAAVASMTRCCQRSLLIQSIPAPLHLSSTDLPRHQRGHHQLGGLLLRHGVHGRAARPGHLQAAHPGQ